MSTTQKQEGLGLLSNILVGPTLDKIQRQRKEILADLDAAVTKLPENQENGKNVTGKK
jgi:hypothetical protein